MYSVEFMTRMKVVCAIHPPSIPTHLPAPGQHEGDLVASGPGAGDGSRSLLLRDSGERTALELLVACLAWLAPGCFLAARIVAGWLGWCWKMVFCPLRSLYPSPWSVYRCGLDVVFAGGCSD